MHKIYLQSHEKNGFSIIEIVVSMGIFSLILTLLISLIYQLNYLNLRVKTDDDVLESGRRIIETIAYEIKGAKGLYTPTTSLNQLSLETARYLTDEEVSSFIDFFICGSNICIKKESQNPLPLISDSAEVEKLEFTVVINTDSPSIKIDLAVKKKNPPNDTQNYSSINLISTVALRNY